MFSEVPQGSAASMLICITISNAIQQYIVKITDMTEHSDLSPHTWYDVCQNNIFEVMLTQLNILLPQVYLMSQAWFEEKSKPTKDLSDAIVEIQHTINYYKNSYFPHFILRIWQYIQNYVIDATENLLNAIKNILHNIGLNI